MGFHLNFAERFLRKRSTRLAARRHARVPRPEKALGPIALTQHSQHFSLVRPAPRIDRMRLKSRKHTSESAHFVCRVLITLFAVFFYPFCAIRLKNKNCIMIEPWSWK